jgi:hypothetical protein
MQVEYRRPDLSIDQLLALRTAASNLARDVDGIFGAETRLLAELGTALVVALHPDASRAADAVVVPHDARPREAAERNTR